MEREKLLNKVVKLFRLGDASRSHTTEGELLAAITKARELMALHNISMVEVEGSLDETKVNELRIKVKEHSACMFVGEETDAHIAGELYTVLLPSLRKFTRSECGSGWSKYHTDYAIGFGRRVVELAQESVKKEESNKSMALVITKKNEALSQYMNKLQLTSTRRRPRKFSDEYNRGYKDGTKMNLSFTKNMRK